MKSCSVTLFIWVYFRFSWLEVKLCLYFEISKELLKPEGKQIPDIDFTKSLDSVDLSQRTHQVTVPLIQKQILAYLTMKQLGVQERVGWRSPEVIIKRIPLMNGIILGSMHQSSVQRVLHESSKWNFHN